MIYLQLFIEFFKIGLFAIGGGLATIPFLRHLSINTGWFDIPFITDMVAISESTPGPIGINMATYVGYNVAGFSGGVLATFGMIVPSIIIVSILSRYLEKYRENHLMEGAFQGLRPAVTALIASAGFDIFKSTILIHKYIEWKFFLLFLFLVFLIRHFKWHPVLYIAIAGAIGFFF